MAPQTTCSISPLRPRDAHMCQLVRSSLVQKLLAACSIARHYLKQYWLMINWDLGKSISESCIKVFPGDHYSDIIISVMASQIYGVRLFHQPFCEDQRNKFRVFVRGIQRWPVDSPHKEPATLKLFLFGGVIMFGVTRSSWRNNLYADMMSNEMINIFFSVLNEDCVATFIPSLVEIDTRLTATVSDVAQA